MYQDYSKAQLKASRREIRDAISKNEARHDAVVWVDDEEAADISRANARLEQEISDIDAELAGRRQEKEERKERKAAKKRIKAERRQQAEVDRAHAEALDEDYDDAYEDEDEETELEAALRDAFDRACGDLLTRLHHFESMPVRFAAPDGMRHVEVQQFNTVVELRIGRHRFRAEWSGGSEEITTSRESWKPSQMPPGHVYVEIPPGTPEDRPKEGAYLHLVGLDGAEHFFEDRDHLLWRWWIRGSQSAKANDRPPHLWHEEKLACEEIMAPIVMPETALKQDRSDVDQ